MRIRYWIVCGHLCKTQLNLHAVQLNLRIPKALIVDGKDRFLRSGVREIPGVVPPDFGPGFWEIALGPEVKRALLPVHLIKLTAI
jgi:hypothetical protein